MRKNPVRWMLSASIFALVVGQVFLLSFIPAAGATEYIQNGDFSQGFQHYTEVTVSAGSFSGFPHFTIQTSANCLPSQSGNPYLAIDVPGGAEGYVEQTVTLPNSATTFSFRSWDNDDPVTVTVSIFTVSDSTEHVLESYTPPRLEIAWPSCPNSPIIKSYALTAYAGQTVKVRLRAKATGYNGTIADFDDLSITDGSSPASYSGAVLLGPANPAVAGPPPCTEGDPVNCVTGNLVETALDVFVPGHGPALKFARTYNSLDAASASAPGALGFGWSHSYGSYLTKDGSGNATVHQGNGATVYFAWNGSSFTPPSFVIATLTLNGDGTYTFTLPDQRSEIFSAAGALTAQTDRNGYQTTLAYNTSGRLMTVTDPAGRKLSFKYGRNGLISTVTDPIGRKVTYGYDSAGNLTSVKDPGGNITRFTYDAYHCLAAVTDAKGGHTTNAYDSKNRVVSQTDAAGRTLTFAYDSGAGTTTVTDGNGNKTVYAHSGNRLASITRGYGTADAAVTAFAYDSAGNRTSITDPNGNVWSGTYDTRGNRLTSVDPLGGTTIFTYDAQNNLLTRRDAMNVTTTFTYNAHGNLTGISRPLNGATKTVTFAYGDSNHPGDLTAFVDSDGYTWSLTYDEYGNVTRRADPDGGIWTGAYNLIGRLTSSVGPRGNVLGANPAQFQTRRAYSPTGDLVRVTDPLGHSKSFTYDKNRNLSTVKDANGHTLRFTYNAANQVVKVTRPDRSVWTNTYDAAGNLTDQTDGRGAYTSYAYDSLNRRIKVTDPVGRVTRFSYDPASNRVGTQDPAGRTATYTYDAANRLTVISYSDMTGTAVSLSYDANGRRTSMTDGTGTTAYQWDSLGRLTGSTDGTGNQVTYAYDLRGHLTQLTYPSGKTVTRAFDPAGRLTSVEDWLGYVSTFQYDASGNLTGITYGNGVSGAFNYDRADRVGQIAYSNGTQAFLNFDYHRNPIGQVVSEAMGREKYTYTYTQTNQLKSVNRSKFGLDAGDNLTTLESAPLSYDAANQLNGMAGSDGSWSFDYDANGNRTRAIGQTTKTYGYDHANRLTSYGANTSYSYNGDGLRMAKTVSGLSSPFVWNVANPLPLLLADGNIQFIYGPNGRPLEQINGDGSVRWFHQDQLGSTRALTDESGNSEGPYRYTPFGRFLPAGPGGEPATPLLFAGQYTDAESGLQYLRARYYDPSTGQFLTRDPLVSITRQPYLYANGDPVNRTDPTGKDQVVIVVNQGAYSVGTSSPLPNNGGYYDMSAQLANGVGQTPHVGVYSGPSTPEGQQCDVEAGYQAAGMISPETSYDFHPYGDNPVSYSVTQNVHVSGDASNPNAVAIVTSTVVDAQGNVVYHNQVTGVVGQGSGVLTSDLMQQGGANVNAFIQGVVNQSQASGE